MSSFNAGRGRGGSQQNIRRSGAFFSSQGSVAGLGAPQTSMTAASAASTADEGASGLSSSSSGFAGPSSRPSSSSGPMGPPPYPGPSSGSMGPPPRPSLFSGPPRRPSIAPLGHIEFDDSPAHSTITSACVGPPQSSLSAPRAISYGTDLHSAPSLSGLAYFNAPPRPTSSTGLGHPNLPSSALVTPPLAIRVPTDALSRFMELKQFMNRLQKAAQDCHTLATNPFAPHLNFMEINYEEEFKIELVAFEEACRLLDQLIVRERDIMRSLMHTVLPMTMRRAVAVRKEVYRLQTSPDTTLNAAVDSLMALFGGLDQMFAGRDFMTEEWVALKDKWLAQGPLFI